MNDLELYYIEQQIDVFIENNIKLNKGDKYVKQYKGSNKRKKIFSRCN